VVAELTRGAGAITYLIRISWVSDFLLGRVVTVFSSTVPWSNRYGPPSAMAIIPRALSVVLGRRPWGHLCLDRSFDSCAPVKKVFPSNGASTYPPA